MSIPSAVLTRLVTRMVASGVACVVLAAVARGADDAAELLAKMKSKALALPRLHAVVRVVDTADDGTVAQRVVESWIDVKHGRARTEVRDLKKALPGFIVCGGPDALRFQRLEVDEVAEQRGRYDLATLLAASFAGELLATAFHGDLMSMKSGAYQKPAVAAEAESVGSEPCVKLVFGGNVEAELWIAPRDGLPRRLRGAVAGRRLDETVTQLETEFERDDVALEIRLVEGDRPLDAATALKRWASLPPERSRWPAVDDPAPDFAAVDLNGSPRLLSETAEEPAVLAFWNAEDDDSVAKAAAVEKAYGEHGDAAVRFIHVAALAERAPVVAAAARHGLRQPVWVAGCHEKNAFRQFHLWTVPLFVRLDDLQVVAITRDVDEARRWFKAR